MVKMHEAITCLKNQGWNEKQILDTIFSISMMMHMDMLVKSGWFQKASDNEIMIYDYLRAIE